MASLIPKIKVGKASGKREKHNLSFDCSTTANIGSIQPTMCREMVPNSKLKVKVSSLVRLSSMPTPTFGRMSLRHYHTFIPYIDLWQPFDAMMSGQHYQGVNTASFIPTSVPYFIFHDLLQFVLNYCDISICIANDLNHPFTMATSNVDWEGNVYPVGDGEGEYATLELATQAAQEADLVRFQTFWTNVRQGSVPIFGNQTFSGLFTEGAGSLKQDDYGVINAGQFYFNVKKSDTTLYTPSHEGSGNCHIYPSGNTPITPEGADLITNVIAANRDYQLLLRFKAPLKRLRQVFIGLGYSFSPYNEDQFSILKLLAYYKAWFALFRPNRELTFVDTACYKLIKKLSEKNGVNARSGLGSTSFFDDFIKELLQCYYYLPMDYYSMAVQRPADSNQDTDFIMNSNGRARVGITSTDVTNNSNDNVTVSGFNHGSAGIPDQMVSMQGTGALSPMTIKLAMRMLTWANKNTVIGRSIREYLKVHFGITDTGTIDDDAVYRIGSSRTNIQISDVMSTAENSEGYLGEYAGKGIGYGDSEKFDFTADKFGVWLTLTVVVPESGYYQGYLKENKHMNRYQFFNPEFDALGYQVLERGEIMDSYHVDSTYWNPRTGFERSKAFGFVPRYSEYKVGRNIVNGDLSLPSLFNTMGAYTLDRVIPDVEYKSTFNKPYSITGESMTRVYAVQPSFVPTIVYDNFRRIDPTDHIGQYNRIFNYVTNDLDHFIIHNVFDVEGYLPMKSLTDSFDTVSKEDDGSIDVTHA